jgi:geranylgeranyl diphosphate synthase type II
LVFFSSKYKPAYAKKRNMELIQSLYQQFEEYLALHPMTREPKNLYAPADYILSIGGKRMRPVFALLGCRLFGKDARLANGAAMAVEVFHNFTLLHDDIMDNAAVRRGQPTVHVKYSQNTAILTGDVMMIQAYQCILNYGDAALVKSMLDVFTKMAFEVCEGQQLDMDFERRVDVTLPEYIQMITLKTSVLVAASIQLGAIIAGASEEDQRHLYLFALNFGIAFQLQDDVLDTFGDGNKVGKRIGGDILQNKKTYLYLKALELGSQEQKSRLLALYSGEEKLRDEEKIESVTHIFKQTLVREYTAQLIEAYRDLAISHLEAAHVQEEEKESLTLFIKQMIVREH